MSHPRQARIGAGVGAGVTRDGLYRVEVPGICAGFVVKNGEVTLCAPILRRRIDFWMTIAVRISD